MKHRSDKYIAGSRTYPGPQPYKLGCSGSRFQLQLASPPLPPSLAPHYASHPHESCQQTLPIFMSSISEPQISPTDGTDSPANDSLIGHPAGGDPCVASDGDSSTGDSPSLSIPCPLTSTPIHSRYNTTERFGLNDFNRSRIHVALATSMAPYILGPMPPKTFLDHFLPLDCLPKDTPSFQKGMFTSLLPPTDTTGAAGASGGTTPYKALVCPPLPDTYLLS
jgi:hypothetical protein